MQIVIDLEDLVYHQIKQHGEVSEFHKLILHGIPLPKGHGRLIDADKIAKQYGLDYATKYGNKNAKQQTFSYGTMMMYEIADMIDDAPTIIEADGGDVE